MVTSSLDSGSVPPRATSRREPVDVRDALRREQRQALRTGIVCWVAIVGVAALVGLAAESAVTPTDQVGSTDPWPVMAVSLAALLLVGELVAVTLAAEHAVLMIDGAGLLSRLWLYLVRVALLVAAAGTLVLVWGGLSDGALDGLRVMDEVDGSRALRWCVGLATSGLVALVVSIGTAAAGWARTRSRSTDDGGVGPIEPGEDAPAQPSGGGGSLVALLVVVLSLAVRLWPWRRRRDHHAVLEAEDPITPDRAGMTPSGRTSDIVAVAASGGGIRAASFVLGGHQALQVARPKMPEPHVFAVSGGSYTAAALALRRWFAPDEDGSQHAQPVGWTEPYRQGSPELDRLRKHTRYLFEPRSRTLDGIVTLLTGAMINIFLAAVAVLVAVWLSVQLTIILGLLVIEPDGVSSRDEVTDFRIVADLGNAALWGLVPMAMVVAAAVLTLLGWFGAALFDRNTAGEPPSDWSPRLVAVSQSGRAPLIAVAIAWLVLVLGLPMATTGIAEAATKNLPTSGVAEAITAMGLVTPEMCRTAFDADVNATVAKVTAAADANPGSERSATAGACGAEVEITRTTTLPAVPGAEAPASSPPAPPAPPAPPTPPTLSDPPSLPPPPPPEPPVPEAPEFSELQSFAGLNAPGSRLAALLPLILGVLALLKRTASSSKDGSTGRFAALRATLSTVLVTWLPLGVTASIAVYLALLWSGGLMLADDADRSALVVSLALAAGAIAFLLNANVTTMHNFYRARIADAFAVGVDDRGNAGPLAAKRVYRFSDLARKADGSVAARPARLHIVATLNTQAANESPTQRAGVPLVFGAEHVQVFDAPGTPIATDMSAYENFAGAGRVSILAAVAVSGAAVSPLMGRESQRMASYRFLLALFNVRLGTWVLNPAHTPRTGSRVGLSRYTGSGADRGWASWLWMTNRPGAGQVLKEGLGSSSMRGRWVYLSDGGHLDNTGLVEAVRHTAGSSSGGRVLCLDASNDPPESWKAVGAAISVIRSDIGIDLREVEVDGLQPWARRYDAVWEAAGGCPEGRLEVLVVKAVRLDDKDESTLAELPPDVRVFRGQNADFPRASTARQKFGDLEFEAYRTFGFAATRAALKAACWDIDGRPLSPAGHGWIDRSDEVEQPLVRHR